MKPVHCLSFKLMSDRVDSFLNLILLKIGPKNSIILLQGQALYVSVWGPLSCLCFLFWAKVQLQKHIQWALD